MSARTRKKVGITTAPTIDLLCASVAGLRREHEDIAARVDKLESLPVGNAGSTLAFNAASWAVSMDNCTQIASLENEQTTRHKVRHAMLHSRLDELVGDFRSHGQCGKSVLSVPVGKLLEWSNRQRLEPDHAWFTEVQL